jgi:LysM repeat protein
MRKIRLILFTLFVLGTVFLSSCAQPPLQLEIAPTRTLREGTLRPYPSNTPSATPLPTDYVSPTPSPTITPTPTPVYYEVREGDDMYGIAFFYGIAPQAIMTANPTVNPRLMGAGTKLLIPITPMPDVTATATPELSPTATPPYIVSEKPDCYPDAAGGLWCFLLLENRQGSALENVSAEVTLVTGDETRNKVAIMPLNLLPAGSALPLVVYFEGPIGDDYEVSTAVNFLLPVMPGDQRYLTVELEGQSIDFSDDGKRADIRGSAILPADGEDAQYLWINATGFDSSGRVVAVRRWESPEGNLSAGDEVPFEFSLYSLAGEIDRVEILAEALSVQPPDNED